MVGVYTEGKFINVNCHNYHISSITTMPCPLLILYFTVHF